MEQLGSHSTNFDEISVFRKSVEKIEVSLKSDKNDGSFTSRRMYNYNNNSFILLRIRNFQTRFEEKIKIHRLFSKTFTRKSCHLWDNVEKYGTAGQATYDMIRRMRTIC